MNNELTAALLTIEKCRELSGCPAGVDLQDWVKQLAAENMGLKAAAKETLAHWAAAEPGQMELMMDKCVPALRDAYCDTPATDRIVAGIKADGVDIIRNALIKFVEDEVGTNDVVPGLIRGAEICVSVADSLREGADK